MNILFFLALLPYVVAGIILITYILLLLYFGISIWLKKWKEWHNTGYCKHEFVLSRTNSFGAKAWYKCKKCHIEKLR